MRKDNGRYEVRLGRGLRLVERAREKIAERKAEQKGFDIGKEWGSYSELAQETYDTTLEGSCWGDSEALSQLRSLRGRYLRVKRSNSIYLSENSKDPFLERLDESICNLADQINSIQSVNPEF